MNNLEELRQKIQTYLQEFNQKIHLGRQKVQEMQVQLKDKINQAKAINPTESVQNIRVGLQEMIEQKWLELKQHIPFLNQNNSAGPAGTMQERISGMIDKHIEIDQAQTPLDQVKQHLKKYPLVQKILEYKKQYQPKLDKIKETVYNRWHAIFKNKSGN